MALPSSTTVLSQGLRPTATAIGVLSHGLFGSGSTLPGASVTATLDVYPLLTGGLLLYP